MFEQRPSSEILGYGVRFQASQAGWSNSDNMGGSARVMEGTRYDRSGRASGTYSFPDGARTLINGHVLRIVLAARVVVLRRRVRARRKSLHKFMVGVATLGADTALFCPSQFARMPLGKRQTSELQTVHYLNFKHIKH